MRAADTSLVVASFASWHENHEAARRVLDGGVRLIEHCALEAYSVLTRLPGGGAAYDALIAATAAECRAALVTCDRRAAAVYESYGVRTEFLT